MPVGVTFSRIIKYGFLNLWRYRWLSATAIVVMAVSLVVTSSILVLNQLAATAAADLRDRVDVSLFFDASVPEVKIMDVKAEFEKLEEVKSIRYISADQALADFKAKHADDPAIQKGLEELEQNPLQPSLVVTAKELSLYPVVIQKIQNSRFETLIAKINYEDSQGLIETLQRLTSGLRNFGILLASVFGF
ncbi:MAG: permease-like cell division protein FtsX, partial [Patescibacteria group bacterium]|nr:permease-like cell division protein FtsX [Patescibacteria group bacterium]